MSRLIAISGLDGAGKTTVAHGLVGELTRRGIPAEQLEAGPSRVWRFVKRLESVEPQLRAALRADQLSVALGFERFGFILDHVAPALSTHEVVVVQRYFLDWAASGRAFGAGEDEVLLFKAFLRLVDLPTTTIYLRVTPDVAEQRLRERGTSIDPREEAAALRRAFHAYEEFADEFDGVVRVDGSRTPAQVLDDVVRLVVAGGPHEAVAAAK